MNERRRKKNTKKKLSCRCELVEEMSLFQNMSFSWNENESEKKRLSPSLLILINHLIPRESCNRKVKEELTIEAAEVYLKHKNRLTLEWNS